MKIGIAKFITDKINKLKAENKRLKVENKTLKGRLNDVFIPPKITSKDIKHNPKSEWYIET